VTIGNIGGRLRVSIHLRAVKALEASSAKPGDGSDEDRPAATPGERLCGSGCCRWRRPGRRRGLLIRHSLRSGDAVQLASCLYLQRETGEQMSFAAFDDRLATAARDEGLTLISFS
jgi:hypothetical protein